MSLLSLRFRNIAAQSKISDMAAQDIQWEQIVPLVATYLTKHFLNAIANRVELNDLISIWNLLGIDSVIRLENKHGESIRVAVALRTRNNKAYFVYRMAQSSALTKIRHLLNIERYWVFCVDEKLFPDRDEWIDILYSQIDSEDYQTKCRLINL